MIDVKDLTEMIFLHATLRKIAIQDELVVGGNLACMRFFVFLRVVLFCKNRNTFSYRR